MKTLLKLAVGISAAGFLVSMLMKRRSGQQAEDSMAAKEAMESSRDDSRDDMAAAGRPDTIGVTNGMSGGDPAQQHSGSQPQDWRGAQNVLDS